MQTIDAYGTFEEAVAQSNPEARQLAYALRKLITEIYADVVEVPWPKLHVIGYGIGPKKRTEHFCYIGMYGSHINLGFNYGSELPAPEHLLEGTGKKFRHVKIQQVEEVARPALRELIGAAVNERALNKTAQI